MAKAPSSYIKTTTAAATRQVDALTFPFTVRPQAMTIYLRFLEQGTVNTTQAGAAILLSIGGASNGLELRSTGTVYTANYFARASEVNVSATGAPTIGQLVELVCQLSASGTVTLIQSINGATATTSAASSALVLPPSWDAATLQLAARVGGSYPGIVAIRDLLIVRGVHDLATMRQRAGLA